MVNSSAFFDQSCGPDKPLEDYPKDLILRLTAPSWPWRSSYRTWDYTERMFAHLRRRRPVLRDLKAQFEAEGNRFLYDSHLGEADGNIVNGAGQQYLYLAW